MAKKSAVMFKIISGNHHTRRALKKLSFSNRVTSRPDSNNDSPVMAHWMVANLVMVSMISAIQSMTAVTMHARIAMKPRDSRRNLSFKLRKMVTPVKTNPPNANEPNDAPKAWPMNSRVVPTNAVVPAGAKYQREIDPPMTNVRISAAIMCDQSHTSKAKTTYGPTQPSVCHSQHGTTSSP